MLGRSSSVLSPGGTLKRKNIEIGPGNLKLSFSLASGQLERIYNSRTGVSKFSSTFGIEEEC